MLRENTINNYSDSIFSNDSEQMELPRDIEQFNDSHDLFKDSEHISHSVSEVTDPALFDHSIETQCPIDK